MPTPTNNFYVYEHWRRDRDECFYVGKGHGRRAYEMRWRKNPLHANVVEYLKRIKSDIEIRIISDAISEKDAFVLEQARIAYWRHLGVRLTNCTDGGEGITGHKHTAEVRDIIRKRHTGVIFTPERRAKIGAKRKGKKHRPDSVEKMKSTKKAWAASNPEYIKVMSLAANSITAKAKRLATIYQRRRADLAIEMFE